MVFKIGCEVFCTKNAYKNCKIMEWVQMKAL